MVNVPEHQRIDYSGVDELTRNIAMTAGEPRAVHLYLEDFGGGTHRHRSALGAILGRTRLGD